MFYQIRFLGLGVVLGERSFFQGNERDKNRTERTIKKKKRTPSLQGWASFISSIYLDLSDLSISIYQGLLKLYIHLSRPFRLQLIHLSRPLITIYSFIQASQTCISIYLGLSDLYIYRPTAPLRHLQLCIQASRTFIYLSRPLRPAYLYIQASQTCMCDSEHMFSCPQQEMDLYGMSKRQVYSGMHKTVE